MNYLSYLTFHITLYRIYLFVSIAIHSILFLDSMYFSSCTEDEDAAALKVLEDIAMRKDQDELLPPVTNTIILARDLLKSDLLASFLFPRPRFIPEDPFGIGAETIIEKTTNAASQDDDEDDNTWQSNIEVTPPQSKRGLLGTPPKVRKSKGVKRKSSQKADGRSTRTRQKQKADLIELQESPLGFVCKSFHVTFVRLSFVFRQ